MTSPLRNSGLVLSGVQPSGSLHLGNYLGALKKFTALQESHAMQRTCFRHGVIVVKRA